MSQLRSLNLEHVSLAELMRQEISRRSPLGQIAEKAARLGQPVANESIFALMRRWFWARKPDAGFVLTGFPATLLQAKVFDEWLEARDESLDAIWVTDASASFSIIEHYRTQGLRIEAGAHAA